MKKLVVYFLYSFKLLLNSSLSSSKSALVGLSRAGDKGDDILARRGTKPSTQAALSMAFRPCCGFSRGTSSSQSLSRRSS